VRLVKWQGLGNDYLIMEASALPAPLCKTAIGALCDRHLGVGADGILLFDEPSGVVPDAVARMRVFNPDGSESEMCGNGIRMFARYLARRGLVDTSGQAEASGVSRATGLGDASGPEQTSEFVVETLAGPIKPSLLHDGRVRVDMGRALFRGPHIDLSALPDDGLLHDGGPAVGEVDLPVDETDVVDRALETEGKVYRFTYVDVGNPHCVILVEHPEAFDVPGVGPLIEHHPAFPNRTNVEFVRVDDDGTASMRVWERGVGETQACGTGATAVGAALVRLGLAASPVLVHLPGGDLVVEVEADGQVFMTGPAEEVFVGELSPELLHRIGWSTAERA